jgi:hypothetical protein
LGHQSPDMVAGKFHQAVWRKESYGKALPILSYPDDSAREHDF